MAAVQRLCTRALLLDHGSVVFTGEPRLAVARYLSAGGRSRYQAAHVSAEPQVLEAELVDAAGNALEHVVVADPVCVRLRIQLPAGSSGTRLGIGVTSADGTPIFTSNLDDVGVVLPPGPGHTTATVTIPANTLLAGEYRVVTCLWTEGEILDLQEPAFSLSVATGASVLYQRDASRKGFVNVRCDWALA